MREFETKSVQLIEKFEQFSEDMAPQVIEASLSIVSISAWSDLIVSLAFLLISLCLAYLQRKNISSLMDDSDPDFLTVLYVVTVCFSLVFGVICFFVKWLNVWTWIAIFNHELALAKMVFGKIL